MKKIKIIKYKDQKEFDKFKLEIRKRIIKVSSDLDFKSLIKLSYSIEWYPNDEKQIKIHFKSFLEKLRKCSDLYCFIYKIKDTKVEINLLSTLSNEKQLNKLKKSWLEIINSQTDLTTSFYIKLQESTEIFDNFIEEILILLNIKSNIKRIIILQKIGINSKLFWGWLKFKNLIKEYHTYFKETEIFIEQPLESSSKINFFNKTNIFNQVVKNLLNTNSKILLEEEIVWEWINHYEISSTNLYEAWNLEWDVEKFLNKWKSKYVNSYLFFLWNLKKISKSITIDFKIKLKEWFNKKKRKNEKTLDLIKSLNLDQKTYELLIWASLAYLIKTWINKIKFSRISYQLGQLILNQISQSNISEINYRPIDYINIGIIIYMIIRNLLQNKLCIDLSKIDDESRIKNILINYNLPMLIKPKDWVNDNFIEDDWILFDTSKIIKGGYLLNGIYLNNSLQKNINNFHLHKLFISKNNLETINKIQKIAFSVNKQLLILYNKYIKNFPDYSSNEERRGLIERRKVILKRKKILLLEKKNLESNKTDISKQKISDIEEQLIAITIKIEDITNRLTKNELLHKILTGFNHLKKYEKFYYSYDLDFRMRLYPQQIELSPQGSKLSRSLIKFAEEFEFNLIEFKRYVVRLYKKIYEFNEDQLDIIFERQIKLILDLFIEDEEKVIKQIFDQAAEPYLFLAACIEYKNYKHAESKGEVYKTGFPLILDCWGSGPQILSLLFLMNDFSKYLNLEPSEDRKDFYISIISKFLRDCNFSYFVDNDNEELLIILRSCCKNVIMTQIYGVTYSNVTNQLKKKFKEKEKWIRQFLIKDIKYSDFIKIFIKNFWDYLKRLPLYKLKNFLKMIIDKLAKEDIELSWTVLDQSKIIVNYQKSVEKKYDFKENILGRIQFTNKEPLKKIDYCKMKTSAQANFIHSFDAGINMYILENYKSSIFSIHDAWGIGMGNSEDLKNLIKNIYYKIAIDNRVLKKLINDFIKILSETISAETGKSFKKYCETNLKTGNYDPNSIFLSKYMIYFG